MDIKALAARYRDETIAFRRDLHMHPELSGEEVRTSSEVEKRLKALGIPHRVVKGLGVIGRIEGGLGPGRHIALRADMDALAVQEESDAPYCSTVPGKAHACGHDCHTAALMTAARLLWETREEWKGVVTLLFQPSEEGPPGGAWQMIDAGAMEGVDAVFAVHMTNNIPAGTVSVEAGPRMAASMRAYIDVLGKSCHGGAPHEGVDAILAASAVVMNLQTITSRELYNLNPAAITVGLFQGGTAFNAVAEKAHLETTVKFYDPAIDGQLREAITRIAVQTASAFRAKAEVELTPMCHPVVNDEALSALAEKTGEKLFGRERVVKCPPWCASEDFSRYLQYAPGVFAFVGGRNEERGFVHPNHSSRFDVDESSLEAAAALYAQFAVDYLSQEG